MKYTGFIIRRNNVSNYKQVQGRAISKQAKCLVKTWCWISIKRKGQDVWGKVEIDKFDTQVRWHGTRPPSTSPPAKSTLNGANKNICTFSHFQKSYLWHFCLGADFKALPLRSTNFSWESFSGGTFFISSLLSGSPLTSRTVIWSLVHGRMTQNR